MAITAAAVGKLMLQQAVPWLIKAAAQLALPGPEKHKKVCEALDQLAPDDVTRATIPTVVESTYQEIKAQAGLNTINVIDSGLTDREWKIRTQQELIDVLEMLRHTVAKLRVPNNKISLDSTSDRQEVGRECVEQLEKWAGFHRAQGRSREARAINGVAERLAAYFDLPEPDAGPEDDS